MNWVLLLVWVSWGGVESQEIHFGTRDLCEGAKDHMIVQWDTEQTELKGYCLQVDRNRP